MSCKDITDHLWHKKETGRWICIHCGDEEEIKQ